MNQQNTMAGKTAAYLVQAIATKLYGEAGTGITDLMTLANRVEASAAGGIGLLLDQQRVTVVADHSQGVAPPTVRAHEVHAEMIDVRLDPAEIRELGPASDALVHCPGVRREDDRLMTQTVEGRSAAVHLSSHPLLTVARRNIRQFLATASFSSSVDRWSAGQCLDVMEAAIDALPAQAVDPSQPNDPGRTLYIDLDGVMADFDAAFPVVFGLDHRSLADDQMWAHINAHPSFFRDLPPMAGALDFFRSVKHLNPVILTACPKSNYPHVAAQKRAWVRQHLSQTCLVLPVLGGRHKPLFMHQPGDILVDDFGKNCIAWAEAGGLAIKHEGNWESTRAALSKTGVHQ